MATFYRRKSYWLILLSKHWLPISNFSRNSTINLCDFPLSPRDCHVTRASQSKCLIPLATAHRSERRSTIGSSKIQLEDICLRDSLFPWGQCKSKIVSARLELTGRVSTSHLSRSGKTNKALRENSVPRTLFESMRSPLYLTVDLSCCNWE